MSSSTSEVDEASSSKPLTETMTLPVPPPSNPSEIYPLDAFPSLDALEERKEYPALSVPAQLTARLRKELKHVLFHRPKFKTIFTDEQDLKRRILLLRHKSDGNNNCLEDAVFQDEALAVLLAQPDNDCRKVTQMVQFSYDDFSAEEIFKKILLFDEIPSAFETVGSIVHLNLREQALPYKYWIGKVILDKLQPRVKTVVNKVGNIETEFRTFSMEVVAGNKEPGWSQVVVKEEGCTFELDFTQVYWNTRLAGEHARLVKLIRKDAAQRQRTTVVADLMAGIGPFAVPLTATTIRNKNSSNIHVHANDLNPSSFKYLKVNAAKNKCQNLECYNMDARAFVGFLQTQPEIDHAIMNLPGSAPEFLDAFRGWSLSTLPRMHVHCFCPKISQTTGYADAIERCATALGCPLNHDSVEVRVVRDVSPTKYMLCVSFDLPKAVRQVPAIVSTPSPVNDEPDTKRTRID